MSETVTKKERDMSVIVALVLQNEKGEIWFGRRPKWGGLWAIPGGHVERNELIEEAARREIQEEVGLDLQELEYLGHAEYIEPKEYHIPKHFVSFEYRARVDGWPTCKTNEEFTETRWMTIDEALKQPDVCHPTRHLLNQMQQDKTCVSCEGHKTKWLRAQADYQNLKKEIEKMRGEWAAMSELHILEEFIPVYDNFKKAFVHDVSEGDVTRWENWKKGIAYIQKQFGDILRAHQIEEIKTTGEPFDPERHEAVGEEKKDDTPSGIILKEIDGGYMLNGKVVKVAKVIIAE